MLYSFRGAAQFRHGFWSMASDSKKTNLQNTMDVNYHGQIWWHCLWIHNMFTAVSRVSIHADSHLQWNSISYLCVSRRCQMHHCCFLLLLSLRFCLVWAFKNIILCAPGLLFRDEPKGHNISSTSNTAFYFTCLSSQQKLKICKSSGTTSTSRIYPIKAGGNLVLQMAFSRQSA